MALTDKLTAICNTIRAKIGKTDLIPLAEIPDKIEEVYDTGVEVGSAELDLEHWKMLTRNGTREYWNNFLSCSDYTGYTFPKPVQISGTNKYYLEGLFYNYQGKYLPSGIDLSGVAENLTMNTTSWFSWSSKLVEIPDMGLPPVNWLTISNVANLEKIEKIRFNGTNKALSISSAPKLKEIGIEGVIGQKVSLSTCSLLNHETLMSIINNLKDYSEDTSGTVYTCAFGTTNLEKLTDEEKAIATQKGWTLA